MWGNWKNTLNNWKGLHERVDKLNKLGGLRIWVLHVLSHGPKNGVEIMDAIEQHYEAMYKMRAHFKEHGHPEKHYNMHLKKTMKRTVSRPSPGSVYPMLKKMLDEELVFKMDDGKYDLTETGRETLYDIFGDHGHHQNYRKEPAIKNALMGLDNYISYLEDVKIEDLMEYEGVVTELNNRLSKILDSVHEK